MSKNTHRLTGRVDFRNAFNPHGLRFLEGEDGNGGTGGDGGDKGGDKPGDKGPALTQADVDRIVADRLTRERAKFADYDELKSKAQRLAEIEEASASDIEKATKKAREEGAAEARATLNRERVLDKIEVAAAGKFADVEDAQLHLSSRSEEFVGKDGAIDTEGIKAAVEKLLTDKPHLKATPDGAGDTSGRAGIGVTGDGNTKAEVKPGMARLRSAYSTTK